MTTLALHKSLQAENVGLTTYAIMRSVHGQLEPPTIAALAVMLGLSYHGLRNHIERTSYFTTIQGNAECPLLRVALTDSARSKLAAITRLIRHHDAAT